MPIVEKQPRPEKVASVTEIKGILSQSTVILTDFQGMDVKTLSKVRTKLRESGSSYKVVKNTLFRLAAADSIASEIAEGLVGQTAIVYSDGDPVAAAKTIQGFTKGPKPIQIKSGIVDGQVLSASQVEELSKIPSKPELLAMMIGGLQSPITNLVGTMQSMISQFVMTLQAVADQKN